MKLSHISLAIVSGAMLVLILGIAYVANTLTTEPVSKKEMNRNDARTEENATDTQQAENKVPRQEVTGTTDTISMLDLQGKGLEQVPAYVFQKTEVEILDLSRNNLAGALQAEVRNLSNLKRVDLSDNLFTGVPAEIGQLSKLEVLNLANNKLTGLPYEIGNLQNLTLLDVRGNTISQKDIEILRAKLPPSTKILFDAGTTI